MAQVRSSYLLIVRHLVAPALEELNFEVRCADGAAFLSFPWRPFTELLEMRHFSALKKLGFTFQLRECVSTSEDELRCMESYIENIFGKNSRRTLSFTYVKQRIICKLVVALTS